MAEPEKMLRRIRLELARDPDFPAGSRDRGFDFLAPLDEQGHIDHRAWTQVKDRCRVRRFWGTEAGEVGHLVHSPGGEWLFHYDIRGDESRDEAGFCFSRHAFLPGEYVSILGQDDVLRTFFVASVREVE